jgi:hypothetical protein
MGMFDLFCIEHKGKEVELQTKLFKNLLDVWRLGDVTNKPETGIKVYYEEKIEKDGELYYDFEDTGDNAVNVYIVLVDGVFVDYSIQKVFSNESTLNIIRELEEEWNDTHKQMQAMVNYLNKKQQEVDHYRKGITTVSGYIREFDVPKEDKHGFHLGITAMHYPKLEEIKTDSDLINVIKNVTEEALDRSKISVYNVDTEETSELEQYQL